MKRCRVIQSRTSHCILLVPIYNVPCLCTKRTFFKKLDEIVNVGNEVLGDSKKILLLLIIEPETVCVLVILTFATGWSKGPLGTARPVQIHFHAKIWPNNIFYSDPGSATGKHVFTLSYLPTFSKIK